jgi:acyl dehydratase
MHHVDELAGTIGRELGVSDWVTIDQERIDRFTAATGDLAHGYLTLSMVPIVLIPLLDLDGVAMSLNYGIDRVRFPHPVRAGSRVRGRVTVESVRETSRGVRLGMACVLEIDGVDTPACVAHPIALLIRSTG